MFNGSVAPVELKLGDKSVRLHPLTFKDTQVLDNIIRGRVIDAARQSITEHTTSQQIRETYAAAFEHAATLSFLSDNMGGSFLESLEGVVTVAHLSLKHSDPDIDVEQVAELMVNKANQQLLAKLMEDQFRGPDPPKRAKGRSKQQV